LEASWPEIFKKIGLNQQQALGYLHRDKGHLHLHLLINRVTKDYKLVSDRYIGIRSQEVADTIAKEMGITRAREIMQKNAIQKIVKNTAKIEKIQSTVIKEPVGSKQLFKVALQNVLSQKPVNREQYFNLLRQEGFILHLYKHPQTELIRGYGIEKDKTKMDASIIGKEFTLTALGFADKIVEKNKLSGTSIEKLEYAIKEKSRQEFKQHLNKIIASRPQTIETYFKAIEKAGLKVKPHFNKQTRLLRGYSISQDGINYIAANEISAKLSLKQLGLNKIL